MTTPPIDLTDWVSRNFNSKHVGGWIIHTPKTDDELRRQAVATAPLDLTALKADALRAQETGCACHPSMSIHPDIVLSLIASVDLWEDRAGEAAGKYIDALARAEAAEKAVERVRAFADYLDTLAPGDKHYAERFRTALGTTP